MGSLKDRIPAIKDSFMAKHSVNTSIDHVWNDLMTELETALDLDECVPKKITRTKDRVLWVTNKLKKQLRKQKKLLQMQKGLSKFSSASQHYKHYKGFVQRQTRQAHWSYINNITSPNEDEAVQESNKRFWIFVKHK